MALATALDVEARLGRPLTPAETGLTPGLLDEASAIVVGEGYVIATPVPPTIAIVVSRMVARVLRSPEDADGLESTQLSAGSFQMTQKYADSSGGPWLSKSDRQMLTPYRRRSAVSVALVSERTL